MITDLELEAARRRLKFHILDGLNSAFLFYLIRGQMPDDLDGVTVDAKQLLLYLEQKLKWPTEKIMGILINGEGLDFDSLSDLALAMECEPIITLRRINL